MPRLWLILLLTSLLCSPLWAQEDAEAAYEAGQAALKARQFEEALGHFETAVRIKPDWAPAHYQRGACLTWLQRLEEALEPYSAAVELRPDFLRAWAARADANFRLGRYEASTSDYGRVIELRPDLWLAYGARGEGRFALGELEDAVADLSQAIDLNPDAGKAYRVRSQARLLQGKILEAIGDAERSVEIETDNPYAALWLAALRQDAEPLEAFASAEGWAGVLVRFFRDELSADELVRQAEESEEAARSMHLSEAHCWLAVRADLGGDFETARQSYQACVEVGAFFLIEHRWAARRLAQLEAR